VGNEKRQEILLSVFSDLSEHNLGEIARRSEIAQSTASQHMAILKRAGIVASRKLEKEVYFKGGSSFDSRDTGPVPVHHGVLFALDFFGDVDSSNGNIPMRRIVGGHINRIRTKPLPGAWAGEKPPNASPGVSFPVDRVGRTYWSLTIPTLATLTINAFIPLMDNLFLGNALGTRGVAALAWGFTTVMFIISAGTWFSYGVAPKVSFAFGEGNPSEADRWTRIGIIGAFLFGVLLPWRSKADCQA
jgi:DNA-binding transcriptional ArsR family regulator